MHWDDLKHQLFSLMCSLHWVVLVSLCSYNRGNKANKQILGFFPFLRREMEGKKYTYIRVLVWIHFWSASLDLPCLDWHHGANSQCLNSPWVFFQDNDDVLSGNNLKGWSIQLRRLEKNYSPSNMHCVGIRSSHLFSLSASYFWTILIILLLG